MIMCERWHACVKGDTSENIVKITPFTQNSHVWKVTVWKVCVKGDTTPAVKNPIWLHSVKKNEMSQCYKMTENI